MSDIKQRKPMTVIKVEMPWPTIESEYWPKKTTVIEHITIDMSFELVAKAYMDHTRWIVLWQHKRCIPKRYVIDMYELQPSESDDYLFWIHSQKREIQRHLFEIVEERKSKKLPIKWIEHLKEIAKTRWLI